ncbi:MAG: thioredoxin [Bacteroidetes bacterium]|nr:MAG: thioredoxin [Bacteroidota bacterium]
MEQFDFQKEVIARSHEVPVVVDFWAPWCGPCRVLGPVLEQMAAEANGRWELVKINTEEHREVAQTYQIMSIPAVKLFFEGKVIGEFVGALPRSQIEKWLDAYIPDERKLQLAEIMSELELDREGGLAKLKNFVQQHPDLDEGRVNLALQLVSEQPQAAKKMVADIHPAHEMYEQAEDVRALAAFYSFEAKDDSPVAQRLEAARQAAQQQNMETALQKLVEAVMIDKNYADELPRKAMIAFFHLLGPEHELTKAYRPRFNMALY